MLPIKAYVIEAYYKWIVASGFTPYIAVDATIDHVDVPQEHVRDGHIILNITPDSIRELVFNPSYISFLAQFSNITRRIYIPVVAIMSIYAKENGSGRAFDDIDEDHDHPLLQPMPYSHFEKDGGDDGRGGQSGGGAPYLRVIK